MTNELSGLTGVDSHVTDFPRLIKAQSAKLAEDQRVIEQLVEQNSGLKQEIEKLQNNKRDDLIRFGIASGLMVTTMIISGVMSVMGSPFWGTVFGLGICIGGIPALFSIASGNDSNPSDIIRNTAQIFSLRWQNKSKPNQDSKPDE